MVQDKKGRDMNKQEEREYWTKLLSDGPVWCEVWDDEDKTYRLVVAYAGGEYPIIAVNALGKVEAIEKYESQMYTTQWWKHATPILPKPRRPWTAEEIMAHGVFERCGDIVRPLAVDNGNVHIVAMHSGTRIYANVTMPRFIEGSRAVCLELRDGILCDTGKRVELYKDGE